MLVTLSDIKAYLGIDPSSTDQDAFLTEQEAVISESVEGYCGRKFLQDEYIQTYYLEDFEYRPSNVQTFHYPLISIASINEYQTALTDTPTLVSVADYRFQKPIGLITANRGYGCGIFFNSGNIVAIQYTAGYAVLPAPIKSVVMSLVEERYNKKNSGVSLNFGSDVQRISIPGTISVDFDYSLQSNERTAAYGTLLGNYTNVLDQYKSERKVVGTGRVSYVDEAP